MRIAMVGARFAGLDGVSLESAKIAEALGYAGHQIVWYAGEVGSEFSPAVVFGSAAFDDEANVEIQRLAFGEGEPDLVRSAIAARTEAIRDSFNAFLDLHRIDAVIVQNAWAIPMHLPLAVAIAEVVRERGIPTIGHHHDFAWERPRFDRCVVPEILDEYFPPSGEHIAHVVINTNAAKQLLARRGLASRVLPNVMDFDRDVAAHDGGEHFRELADVGPADILLLQPTRVIRRKGIEMTLELASRMAGDPRVIVAHPDDVDAEYWERLMALATSLDVDLRLVAAGRNRHSLASAYAAADLVCFPSTYEGFGNALVEAVYYRRPVMVNRYPVYDSDIAPLGFEFLEMDGVVLDEAVDAASEIVRGGVAVDAAANRNFEIGLSELSYSKAVHEIETSLADVM